MSILVAQPWWVNLSAGIPFAVYFLWRRDGNGLTARALLYGGIFALAFGFVEASVVVYLRAATGLLGATAEAAYQQAQLLHGIPATLMKIEVAREAATMVMLASVALLASENARARWAMFLWTFAIWDIVYYAGLWALVRWPGSLRETDVLFLIPVPWLAPVWFPVAVSALMITAVVAGSWRSAGSEKPTGKRDSSLRSERQTTGNANDG
ncbi:MAG TPA: hypothetical protein VLV88_06720 [Terriglobales bacterium]|nr:hypothetical protein [Terriglobales bacterium]